MNDIPFSRLKLYQIIVIGVTCVTGTYGLCKVLLIDPVERDNKYYKERLLAKENEVKELEDKAFQLKEINRILVEEIDSIKSPESKPPLITKVIDFGDLISDGKILLKRATGEHPNNPVTKIELEKWRRSCSIRLSKISQKLSDEFLKKTKNSGSDMEKDKFILNGIMFLESIS